LAERLVRHAVPADASGLSIVGDLRQEFDERAHVRGLRAAQWWYWRQSWSLWWWALRHPEGSHHHPRGGVMFDALTDFRHAVRAARKAGSQTVLIVSMLALTIGTTTIGFTFLDLAVLRGMPVDDPDRVVYLFAVDPRTGNDRAYVTQGDFADYRARSRTTENLAAFEYGRGPLIEGGAVTALDIGRATADYFAAMGQSPRMGRYFVDGDDRPGAAPVAVVAHAYWRDVMGADPGVLGRVLQLGRQAHVIVGVAGPEMEFGTLAVIDVWVPLTIETGARSARRTRVIGRLAPGRDFAAAAAEFAVIGDGLAREYPDTNAGWRARLAPISEATGGRNFWVIIALFSLAVILVVAIACANVANVLLVRATALGRDVAIRAALGASRLRVVRAIVFEGLLLSVASGLLAVPLAEGLLRIIRSIDGEPALQQLRLDWHELGFIASIVLIAPIIFAVVPARQVARTDVRSALAAGGTRVVSSGRRSRSVLVVAQVALAVVLLITSGLAVRTAINISGADTGLRTEHVVKFELELDAEQYPDPSVVPAALDDVRGRLAALPGIRAVGVFDRLPVIQGGSTASLAIGDETAPADGSGPWALVGRTRAQSLDALGVRLLDGRDLPPDASAAARVALISREAARRYYGGSSAALGKTLTVIHADMPSVPREIIGVVTDTAGGDIALGPQPYVWIDLGDVRRVGFVLAAIDPTHAGTLAPGVRETVRAVLPTTPVERLEGYTAALDRLIASDLVIISMLVGFAGLALVMAAIGLYAVVAYSAGQRRAEFSTRVALGARGADVIRLVVGDAARLLMPGLGIGLAGGLLAGFGMRSALIGVEPMDTFTLTVVIGLLALVTVVASLGPALRASRVDLVTSLRAE
jgi:putative ABC transport system permease protein